MNERKVQSGCYRKKSSPVSEQVVPRSTEIDLLLVHGAGILRIAAAFHSRSVSQRASERREEPRQCGRLLDAENSVLFRTYRSAQVQRGCYSFTHRRVVLVRPSNSAFCCAFTVLRRECAGRCWCMMRILWYCCLCTLVYAAGIWPDRYGAGTVGASPAVQPLEYSRSRVHCAGDVHLTFVIIAADKFAHPRSVRSTI